MSEENVLGDQSPSESVVKYNSKRKMDCILLECIQTKRRKTDIEAQMARKRVELRNVNEQVNKLKVQFTVLKQRLETKLEQQTLLEATISELFTSWNEATG